MSNQTGAGAATSDHDGEHQRHLRTVAGRYQGRRQGHLLAAVGVTALVAAGCGGAAKTAAPPSSAVTTTRGAAGRSPSNEAAAAKITAKLTDFHIALSRVDLAAGTYTFVAVNAGHTSHSLEIDGPGVSNKALPALLAPGQSADLTVTLRAGRYDVFCPVPGHKALGMNLELTVGGAAGAAAGPTATTAAPGGGNGY
jgi:uncharacterized cupredoxin-like copper-binding protein